MTLKPPASVSDGEDCRHLTFSSAELLSRPFSEDWYDRWLHGSFNVLHPDLHKSLATTGATP